MKKRLATRMACHPVSKVGRLVKLAISGLILFGAVTQVGAETVAHWRFEERTGGPVFAGSSGGSVSNTLLDSSGKGNHMQTWTTATAPTYTPTVPFPRGTLSGTPATGAINTAALDFTGAPVDIYAGAKPINNKTFNAWTVEAAFRLDVSGRWQVIVGKDGNPVGSQPPLSLKIRADDKLEIGVVDGAGIARWCVGNTQVVANKWYRAAAVANATELSLWIKPEDCRDYIPQGSVPIQGAFFNNYGTFNQPWIIGRGMWNGVMTDATDGKIDDVRISDSALTQNQFLGNFGSLDSDADGLPDAWELVHFRSNASESNSVILAKQSSLTADPDGDGFSNRVELRSGTNPGVADNLTGKLTRQVWLKIPGDTLTDLIKEPRFYRKADITTLNDGISSPRDFADNFGERLQGWVTAPVTGDYTFWVAGDNQCELWLSTDQSRFNKQLVASVPTWSAPDEWDKFSSQKSAVIQLVAGQKYFIESFHKEGGLADSLSVAWQAPGQARAIIPAAYLKPYVEDPQDQDLDGLPDSWETLHGLNPSDDGGFDIPQGPLGDSDDDGYTNIEEYELGMSPVVWGGVPGVLTHEVWKGIGGSSIYNLISSPAFHTTPAPFETFEMGGYIPPQGESYGERVRGWLTPPVTGDYKFWIAGDDDLGLWLSPNDNPFQRRKIASTAIHTSINEWSKMTNQESAPVHLVAGTRYFIEYLHKGGIGFNFAQLAWTAPGSVRSPIPASVFESYSQVPQDADNDNLPDAWEAAHSGPSDGGLAPQGDEDHDGFSNYVEFMGGANPLLIDSVKGTLSTDVWWWQPYFTLAEVYEHDGYYLPPTFTTAWGKSTSGRLNWQYFTTRTRGYLHPEESGTYRFWISASTAADLWLSTDDSKYGKRRIARVSPDLGQGRGVDWNLWNTWDVYESQLSEPIRLEAGRRYFIEAEQQHHHDHLPHVSIAWAKEGGPRDFIPSDLLSSYVPQPNDADDDYLPDDWEAANGLSVEDNGLHDRLHQGERGDFDADGVPNRMEFLIGTNPATADTDVDGISDADEMHNRGSDPLSYAPSNEAVVSTLPLTPASSSEAWVPTANGMAQETFRGSAKWNFTVPDEGVWIVEIEAALIGKTHIEEDLRLESRIDAKVVGRTDVNFRREGVSNLRLVTPRLTAGPHELDLLVDNYITRRRLEVRKISMIRPAGLDLDMDGVPDSIETTLAAANTKATHEIVTHVSPFFIEGTARDPQSVNLTVLGGQNSGSQRLNEAQWQARIQQTEEDRENYANLLLESIRRGNGRLGGTEVASRLGAGHDSWFAYLALTPNETATYVAAFENLQFAESGTLAWKPYNVLQGGEMTIPVGSEVLLGAWESDNDQSQVSLTIDGVATALQATGSVRKQFTASGIFTVIAHHPTGTAGTLTIHVKTADFGKRFEAVEQSPRDWTMNGVAHELALDAGLGSVKFTNETAMPAGGTRATVLPQWPGAHRVTARLWENGPVLATGSVNVMAYSDALRNDDNASIGVDEGIATVRSPLVLTGLPEGGYARITIFRAGVTFTDGSTERIIRAGDLDENGAFILNFLFPLSIGGGFCHYIDIFDANGFLVRRG